MYSVWHDAFADPSGKVWMHTKTPFGPRGAAHWWGSPSICPIPKYRFVNTDGNPNAKLIDYHAKLLTDAKVDFIFIDLTNGEQPDILKGAHAVCARYTHLVRTGHEVPGVVLWCMRPESAHIMHTQFYANPKYDARIFFRWEGKPLMLVRPFPRIDQPLDVSKLPRGYTYRTAWGLWSDPSIMWSVRNNQLPYAGFVKNREVEQMPVAFASQRYHMHNDSDKAMEKGRRGREDGRFFMRCFDQVKRDKPRVMLVSTWNEWLSQNMSDEPRKGVFTDVFGPEYSCDCEPSEEHGTKYYNMLVAVIRAFKSM